MKYKLIKTDGYYMIVSEEKQKVDSNKWYYESENTIPVYQFHKETLPNEYYLQEILYSQNPEHSLPTITFSDGVAKELGIVNVNPYDLAMSETERLKFSEYLYPTQKVMMEEHYVKGYNQALSDNKDKLFTLEDIRVAIDFGKNIRGEKSFIDHHNYDSPFINYEDSTYETEQYIQSLTKQEWEVELEMEWIQQPKITDNSVKVIKLNN